MPLAPPPVESFETYGSEFEDESLQATRELILHNFLSRLAEEDIPEDIREYIDETLASFANSEPHTMAANHANTGLLSQAYARHLSGIIENTAGNADGDIHRSVKRTVGVLCNEAYMRSLVYELILDLAHHESGAINDLATNKWHDPEALESELWERIERAELTDPASILDLLQRMGLVASRFQLVDEMLFMQDRLRPVAPGNPNRLQRVMGFLTRRAA